MPFEVMLLGDVAIELLMLRDQEISDAALGPCDGLLFYQQFLAIENEGSKITAVSCLT